MKTNRRQFIQSLAAGFAGFSLTPFLSADGKNRQLDSWSPIVNEKQQLYVGDKTAIADTQYGKVQGLILRDIYTFRGIPYGADTGGKNRFMPPQKPEPWDDIFPAIWWGDDAPQIMEGRYSNPYYSFRDHWNYYDLSEDCLNLNVWTPEINDNKKRPVLVWLHGGGFRNGNSIEQDGYKGENLSRKGDIVFVSINHRLGPIGFSDLSGVGGSKYADSGNVGALDMVAALEWVKENISNFGGDPDNVTIIGQSGGGAKVCILMNMPQAKGLFHKAVALSGSSLGANDQKASRGVGQYILKEADLDQGQLDKLQEMPWLDYLKLADKAAGKYAKDNSGNNFMGRFGPVADGKNILKGEFFNDPNGLSTNVPLIISSTFDEFASSVDNPEIENITKQEAIKRLRERAGFRGGLGDKAPGAYEAYAKAFPESNDSALPQATSPYDVMVLVQSGSMRNGVVRTANAKVKQKAPVYVDWFGWKPPMFNGRLGAFHTLDICFWFANTDLSLSHTGGGERPRALSEKMSSALLQFMRSGDPNTKELPYWPAYTPEDGATMILNDHCEVKNNPDGEARAHL
ncbi:MAG TPA: carboxylesterase family protein [Balneolaceae bacterium]|nr:carboxylesterase family protein [Balneolaceae bacterium]